MGEPSIEGKDIRLRVVELRRQGRRVTSSSVRPGVRRIRGQGCKSQEPRLRKGQVYEPMFSLWSDMTETVGWQAEYDLRRSKVKEGR